MAPLVGPSCALETSPPPAELATQPAHHTATVDARNTNGEGAGARRAGEERLTDERSQDGESESAVEQERAPDGRATSGSEPACRATATVARATNPAQLVRDALLLEVPLVVVFGGVEGRRRDDLRHDRALVHRLRAVASRFGDGLLRG
jgi:hypothetical protein